MKIAEIAYYTMRNLRDQERVKVIVQARRIAQLEADAKLADAAYLDHLAACRAMSAEIAALKRELNTCKHMRVTIHSRLFAAETREEPADYEESAQCSDCGKWMAIEDIPEDAEVKG